LTGAPARIGHANFEGGKLAGKVGLRFKPGTERIPDDLAGGKQISSREKKLRGVKPVVESPITVFFRLPQ
jgi:hypothetical protein